MDIYVSLTKKALFTGTLVRYFHLIIEHVFVYNGSEITKLGCFIMMDYSTLPKHDILCIDMRSFYASCEAVALGMDPEDCYLAVVGDPDLSSSIVLASSPKLKRDFGIKTGNRVFEIPKHRNIRLVGARMGYYLQKSIEITQIYYGYVPLEDIHIYSIDEAWLKVDGSEGIFGDKRAIAQKIKDEIYRELGLPSAVGIGPNRFLSKVCLDIEGKKRGIACWEYEDVPRKLWPLPTKKCWGIGSAMARNLKNLGIHTLGQLAHYPLEVLESKFGVMGNQLYYHAWGVDLSLLEGNLYPPIPKSIGKGITLEEDYRDGDRVKTVILELCEDICRRARKQRLVGKSVHLSLRYSKAQGGGGLSHSLTMEHRSNLTLDIYRLCLEILKRYPIQGWVRKISVALCNLRSEDVLQLDFFRPALLRDRILAQTMDELHDRFGPATVFRARSLSPGAITFKQKNKLGGHNR